jgi:hypothetical protein
MTRVMAERCRQLKLAFIDTAGNAYIAIQGLTIFITGEPRPAALTNDAHHYRAYTEVDMKVVFALLCNQDLANATYRELARAAQVALGTVGPVIKDLENRGHLIRHWRQRILAGTRELMEDWVARYPDALRPKFFQNRYQVEIARLHALDVTKSTQSGERKLRPSI